MKRKKHLSPPFALLATAALLLLASCDKEKDPVYNTSHPEHGAVTLTTDWSNIGEGLTAPDSYTATAGDYTATLSGTVNLLDHLFDPGEYTLYTYNAAEHIAVSGTTASVAAATPPAGQSGAFIHNTPGWLFTAVTPAVIEADTDHALTAVMQQQVRQLTIMIEPTGGTTDRITSIEGWLTGAAASLNFADGTHATPSNVELQFARIADGSNAGKWTATVRLLGTAGPQQKLNAMIYFEGVTPTTITLDSDLSTELAAFNADKRTPLTLGGKMVETPTGAGFTATITDWKPVGGGDVSAD